MIKIGDTVIAGLHPGVGRVIDIKWNVYLVRFENGKSRWITDQYVKLKEEGG